MADLSIRIDVGTARLVAELAHLMETSKKAVMADAVAGYAQAASGAREWADPLRRSLAS
ncbi:hypothetical protein [Agromyces sp. Marseille-Q5079]|uniref:hypothetical protein n=1 Tax=Agromyces sp. Marseille-Q5079 TaxID=3439059 RepID=UPI003D9CB07D